MRTIRIKLYKFGELSEAAKQRAVSQLADINVDYEWWDFIYEDAERVGLKIKVFDIDRKSYVNADFIEDACFTANKIKEEHGIDCASYKTAEAFILERDNIVDTAEKDENGDCVDASELDKKLDDCESEFLKAICEDYRIMLSKEYDYRGSEAAIIETIKANDYEFTAEGKFH